MTIEEKMIAWHYRGVFDLEDTTPEDDGSGKQTTKGANIQGYLHLIHRTRQALLKLRVWDRDWVAQ